MRNKAKTERLGPSGRSGKRSSRSIRCNFLFGIIRFPPLYQAIRRQASVANLVEQCTVADAQSTRRLLAVPMMVLQDLQDNLSLQFADCLAGQLLERDGPID